MNIAGLSKAALLAELFNNATPQGLGFLIANNAPMTESEAQALIDERKKLKMPLRFDYIKGRSCKIDISTNDFDPWLYDRDNGAGTASRIVKQLRAQKIH